MTARASAKPRRKSRLKSRPPVGSRVRISAWAQSSWTGKTGTVVAHHGDSIAIIVRLDPQKPLRPYRSDWRKFDRQTGIEFRRRDGDVVVDYHHVTISPEKGDTR